MLPESIDRTPFGVTSWASDSSGFVYHRLKAGVPLDSLAKYMDSAAWYHRLRTDPGADIRLLAKGSSPVVAMTDVDSRFVQTEPGSSFAIGAVVSGVQNESALFISPVDAVIAGRPEWRPVCSASDKVTSGAGYRDEIYLLTHKDAPRFKVIKVSAAAPSVANARVVVPESASVIRDITAAKDGLYIHQLDAGLGGVRRLGWGSAITTIALPHPGTVSELYADTLHDGAWFLLAGWVRPPVLYYVNLNGVVTQTDIAPAPPIDVSPSVSFETFARAADGVQIQLSILYRKALKRDGAAPLILNADGSYGITQEPSFAARWLAFLDLGGVYAVAHVRGGGELGGDWHMAGYKATKFNTWRDMIASAEHLIAEGYTSKAKLGIIGGSAGGITVGRFMTERPDLAAVVFDQVGSSNQLRAEFSPNGPANIPEFGSVLSETGFKALYAMDAYQHVKDGVAYPSVFLTTGLNDPRVASWEPTKMAAASRRRHHRRTR